MRGHFAIVDLFAGPGGLAEGFSKVSRNGSQPLRMALSIEKEATAHSTLLLRSFLRQFGDRFPKRYYDFLNSGGPEPDWGNLHPKEWQLASAEALKLELGTPEGNREIDQRLDNIREANHGDVILIGGPPCQAYSLVGRARNLGNKSYVAGDDARHFLYREYIRILAKLKPAAFVMENVKGILSSSVEGEAIFDRVLEDLARPARGLQRPGSSEETGGLPIVCPVEDTAAFFPPAHRKDLVVSALPETLREAILSFVLAWRETPRDHHVDVRDIRTLSNAELERIIRDAEDDPTMRHGRPRLTAG